MRRSILAELAGSALLMATTFLPASAADMPVKAPAPPPPLVSGWSGFYVGGALGAKWEDARWTTTSVVSVGDFVALDASSPGSFDPSGVRGGLYMGYNWQVVARWVAGVEFDWADANKTVTAAGIPGCSISCQSTPGPAADLSSVKMGWDASARGRLGYLISPNLLFYGTGGVAWQSIGSSATCQFSSPDPVCLVSAGTPFGTASNGTIRTGWTIGTGVEVKFANDWILRAEYRYADFGTWNVQNNLSPPGTAPGTGVTNLGYQLKINTQLATAGLAYRFGP